jgi:hypothetical protein
MRYLFGAHKQTTDLERNRQAREVTKISRACERMRGYKPACIARQMVENSGGDLCGLSPGAYYVQSRTLSQSIWRIAQIEGVYGKKSDIAS